MTPRCKIHLGVKIPWCIHQQGFLTPPYLTSVSGGLPGVFINRESLGLLVYVSPGSLDSPVTHNPGSWFQLQIHLSKEIRLNSNSGKITSNWTRRRHLLKKPKVTRQQW